MSENNGDLVNLLTSIGVAFSLAQRLSEDPWITSERITQWQLYVQDNPGIPKPAGFIANQLKGHVEPPARKTQDDPRSMSTGEFWERMRNDPEFREAYCKKWGIDY